MFSLASQLKFPFPCVCIVAEHHPRGRKDEDEEEVEEKLKDMPFQQRETFVAVMSRTHLAQRKHSF